MAEFIDLSGFKYGMLRVIQLHCGGHGLHLEWECICDCGNMTKVRSSNLKNGQVKSCGCLGKDNLQNIKHGLKGTRLYAIWDNMKGRCYRPSMECFKNYGAKGIIICKEWLDDCKKFFEWAMANGYTEELTIERIDVKGNYEPSNCKWIPQCEQSRNRTVALGIEKVFEIKIKLQEGISCASIAIEYNVDRSTISNIKRGKAYAYVRI